ncbi:histone H3.v1-like [Argopecten irradians]|uniref:histone H3.v1-like n=1 Tax=Argopecten irradians TaxID=31199 RepID=UPI00371AAFAC
MPASDSRSPIRSTTPNPVISNSTLSSPASSSFSSPSPRPTSQLPNHHDTFRTPTNRRRTRASSRLSNETTTSNRFTSLSPPPSTPKRKRDSTSVSPSNTPRKARRSLSVKPLPTPNKTRPSNPLPSPTSYAQAATKPPSVNRHPNTSNKSAMETPIH